MGLVRRSLLGVLVVVLAAPVAVAVDLVTASDVLTTDTTLPQDGGGGGGAAQGASEAETTDTTLSGSSGDAAGSGSGGVRGASHCDGRRHRIDGTCRACPKLDEYHDGTSCVKKTKPAPKDPTCPAGQTYFSSYGGCRPSSCPHGRTSTGWCRSRPPPTTAPRTTTTTLPSCPSGQSYLAEYGGCRTTTCENCRSSEGWCRACVDPFKYHNGAMCVLKTKAAPADPACTEDDHLYYGCFEGCRPKTCPPGHERTDDGWCNNPGTTLPRPTTTLAKPTGVKANGHASTAANENSGISFVEWTHVPGATRYEVRYTEWFVETEDLDYLPGDNDKITWNGRTEKRWKPLSGPLVVDVPQRIGSGYTPSVTIRSLKLKPSYLYLVQVRATSSSATESEWSDRVYTYPTSSSSKYLPEMWDRVGMLTIDGYQSDAAYTFTLCEDTIPPRSGSKGIQDKIAEQFSLGIEKWETVSDELFTVTMRRYSAPALSTVTTMNQDDPCSEKRLKLEVRDINIAVFTNTVEEMDILCDNRKAPGCAPGDIAKGMVSYTAIVIRYMDDLLLNDGKACSELSRLALHEGGHAIRFLDPNSPLLSYSFDNSDWDNRSVMWMSDDELCEPQEYDIVALKAIYQSRQPS